MVFVIYCYHFCSNEPKVTNIYEWSDFSFMESWGPERTILTDKLIIGLNTISETSKNFNQIL